MDIGTLRGLLTAALLVLFIGVFAWAWSRRRLPDFEAASRLPLDDSMDDSMDDPLKYKGPEAGGTADKERET